MKHSSGILDIPEGKIYFESWTPAVQKGSPIVLLHESLGCVAMWRDFPQQLVQKTGRQVIAYDRLGFGKSSARIELPSTDFIAEEAQQYLPNILKQLQIDKIVLFGHSVGGGMAIMCGKYLGEQCEAIISESAQAFVEERTRQGIMQAEGSFKKPAVFAKLEKYHGDKTQWVLDAWIKVWLSESFANWSLAKDLSSVKCPLLVIHGDRDEYGSVDFPETLARLAGGLVRKEIIPQCGHIPHREKPDVVLKMIHEFLL
ncbi:MAG: alpha/beta fold hydrolase [Bdellovibrio sp.]